MLYPNLDSKRIILASKSPRRLELVRGLEIEPEVMVKDVDESYPPSLSGVEVAKFVTMAKASAFYHMMEPEDVLITGDTIVLLEGDILEKPSHAEEAADMLRKLSGKTHVVASGIAVTTLIRRRTRDFMRSRHMPSHIRGIDRRSHRALHREVQSV